MTFRILALLGLSAMISTAVRGDEREGDEEQSLVEAWLSVYDAIAESYSAATELDSGESRSLEKRQILTLTNAEWGGRHGRFWLWTLDGRPMATTALLSGIREPGTNQRRMMFEFHSLAEHPVELMWRDARYWYTREPGIEWMKLASETSPSSRKSGRLIQMRRIARSFVARAESRPRKQYVEFFRLMPQPVYRYPDDTPNVIDGAVFAYGVYSDPSVLLLIEARDDGWWIAFARSNWFELTVRKDDEVIWRVKEGDSGRNRPFWYFSAGRYLDSEPDTARADLAGN